ncbi:efflux RND transporter periplasmic adaptor subunit [Desulfococcus sp.]|uniref:efflux RND transporter periplasmic adaptor subunit n=1 Tax=Desulfococcus sp. TaxID=2025834 RepID=UPI0035935CDC
MNTTRSESNTGRPGLGALPGCMLPVLALMVLCRVNGALAAPPKAGPPQMPPPVVSVAVIAEKTVNPPMTYVGRVEAIQAVDLRARVEGTLEQVKFREGGRVKSGERLYVIEQAAYKARMDADQARIAEARAALAKARQYRERLQSVRKGGVSKTDLETAQANEQEAQAQVDAATANLALSRLNLEYTTIEAPITGRIGATNITSGNLVGPDSGILGRIVQLDPIRVVYSVSETDLVSVRLKSTAEGVDEEKMKARLVPQIRLGNGAMYEIPGRLDFSDNEVDPATGTIAVRAIFDNPDGILLPGQYVTVLLSLSNPRKMPVVPQSAVLEDRDGRYVFVVDGESRAQQRRITTGAPVDTDWAVSSGLMAGETVIVSGVQKVRPGQAVNPVTADKR